MTGIENDEVARYVEQVAVALGDLPPATRQELLDDLPEHLAEVRAEGDESLVDRLGPAEAYAAELRASAGAPDAPGGPAGRSARWAATSAALRRRFGAADHRLGPVLGYATASDFLRLLRPAWWVLRGYLAAMVVAFLLDDSGQPRGLLPRIGGSEAVALFLIAAGVLGSVWLGRRQARLGKWPRYAVGSATVLLALVAFSGFVAADQSVRGGSYQEVLYDNPYGHVRDVYVYDGAGRLLTGVRLFDQDGRPIRLGAGWCVDDRWPPEKQFRPEFEDGFPPGVEVRPVPPAPDADLTYPFCPDRAPFRLPQPSATPPPTATPTPAPTATPSPAKPAPTVATPPAPAPSPS